MTDAANAFFQYGSFMATLVLLAGLFTFVTGKLNGYWATLVKQVYLSLAVLSTALGCVLVAVHG